MGHSHPLLFFIYVFSIQVTVNSQYNIFADDWIRTADLWCRKRPLYQVIHKQPPPQIFSHPVTKLTYKLIWTGWCHLRRRILIRTFEKLFLCAQQKLEMKQKMSTCDVTSCKGQNVVLKETMQWRRSVKSDAIIIHDFSLNEKFAAAAAHCLKTFQTSSGQAI